MPQIDTEGRHPEIQSLARYFDYDHLESPLREFSQQCYDLAANMIDDLPDSPELTVGLRKLLEAKDCFVRASMDLLMQQRIQESAELHEKRKESIVRDSERFGKVDEDHPYGYDR